MKYDPGTERRHPPPAACARTCTLALVGYSIAGFIGSNLVGRPLGALRQILSAIFKNLSLSLSRCVSNMAVQGAHCLPAFALYLLSARARSLPRTFFYSFFFRFLFLSLRNLPPSYLFIFHPNVSEALRLL